MKKSLIYILLLLVLPVSLSAQVTVTGSTSADGSYTRLALAFTAINSSAQTGNNIIITLSAGTTETTTAVLNSGSWTSLNIYPVATGIIITGNLSAPLIDFNGADNVTIDGRVNATGVTKDLIITNISTSNTSGTSTIRFINDATGNTIKYCTLKGSASGTNSGILFFSTTTGTTGNNGNIIDNNDITGSADANRPKNAIYSAGTASLENSGDTIRNNNIYNHLSKGLASNGIFIDANNSGWTISGNSFYETTSFVPAASVQYNIIIINNSGVNYSVSNNFIGGSASLCGGTAMTKSNVFNNTFYGIYLNAGIGTTSSVQNNTIRNIAWSNLQYATWTAIHIAGGDVNVGTITGNTIGSVTGTGSISVTSAGTNNNNKVYGINITSTGTVICQKNNIGSITIANTDDNGSNFYGINKAFSTGTLTISNNTIGSTSTANSILASSHSSGSANAQTVWGIYNAGSGSVTISGNTIANLTNGTTNTTLTTLGKITGIFSSSGTNTISDNIIHDLTIANANSQPTLNVAVCGIALSGTSPKNLTGNTIYNLSNTYPTYSGFVSGIIFNGSTGGNTVSRNFVHSLSVVSSSATIVGLNINSGSSTFSNNIISLSGNTATTLFGIYETGASGNNNNIYFNTVSICGSVASGTSKSFALYSASIANSRNFRNNIFVNARSTTGGTNLHYAIYLAATGGTITCNYNDYWVSGTGGILGHYGADKPTLPIVTDQDGASLSVNPIFASACSTVASDFIPSDSTLIAETGTGITDDYASKPRNPDYPSMGAFEIKISLNVDVYKANLLQASYFRLKEAFDAINAGTLNTGSFEIRIRRSISEISSAVLNASGKGSANYQSVIIYPTASGITISGNIAAPLIDLNGADNVTIDGRANASGATKDMTITNTSTSASDSTSTIRTINGATNNRVKYCILKGSETGVKSGVLLFSTTTGTTGNSGNVIDNNDITGSADANRPRNAIYSAGTAALENSGDTIRNNNIYNHLNKGLASNGIFIDANNSGWTISGNSFYETTSFVPAATVQYNIIIIINSGVNYSVSNNFIGGSASLCGGTALTKTNAFNNIFYGIYLHSGIGTASSVQNNTIRNIAWSNLLYAIWTGIHIAGGDVNVGTITGNTIGSVTGTGSISVTSAGTNNNNKVYGINITSTGNVNCQKNNIGSITIANTDDNGSNFYGINKAFSTGTIIISNNSIGSTSTANSILASSHSSGSANAQTVWGIYNAGSGSVTISGNTIANLTNGTTNTTSTTLGKITGIFSSSGTNTISDNIIHDLTIANANNQPNLNVGVCGIALSGASLKNVTGNTIYNLSNTFPTYSGFVSGIIFNGSTGGNTVSRNFVHSLSVTASSATIIGLIINSGSSTFSNNIISLGGNTATTLLGIYESGASGNNDNLYFNTVYIGGSPSSGSSPSYALYNNSNNNIRNFRNNLFVNARSNNGSSGTHYAIRLAGKTNLTINYNDYYVSGTGGVLGSFTDDKMTLLAWQTATGQDAQSQALNPEFVNAGGIIPAEYVPHSDLTGIDMPGITTDFGWITRSNPPTMGAWEGVFNLWKGTTSEDWGTPSNWTKGVIPNTDANIGFDPSPIRNCRMDIDRSVDNIINSTNYRVITNGRKLTIKGTLIFSNGALIDATANYSAIEYNGPTLQSIMPGSFLNDQIYNLTINNTNNVILSGTLNLLDSLTAPSGVLDAYTATPTLIYGGTSPQTISGSVFLDSLLYNLTIANTSGVSLISDLTVNNSLTINSGRLLSVLAPNVLKVPGTITNNAGTAGFVIKSDAYGNDAKLINDNSSINASVELYLDGGLSPLGKKHHYFVPPVQSMTVGATIPAVNTNLNVTYFNGTLLSYDESKGIYLKDQGWNYFDGYNNTTPFPNNAIISGKGYDIYFTQDDKITFKGLLNSGEHSFNLGFTTGNADPGWNLIGNPYPCNYDLTGIAELMGPGSDNVDNTIYYYTNHSDKSYNVSTGVGDPDYTNIIPPMQGFSVHVTAPVIISLPVTSKTSDASGVHRSKGLIIDKKSLIRKLKLSLNNGEYANATYVSFLDKATTGFDGDFDAYKVFRKDSDLPLIYTELNGIKYAINSVQEQINEPLIIPVTVEIKKQGGYTIEVPEFENLEGYTIVLKHGVVETSLKKGSKYTFTSGPGIFKDFELIIGDKNSVKGDVNPTSSDFTTWYNENILYINCPADILSDKGKLIIFDAQGIMVLNKQLPLLSGETMQVPVNLTRGFYIINVVADNQSFKSKIVVF